MSFIKNYLSLIMLFMPGLCFVGLLFVFKDAPPLQFNTVFPFIPWQFYIIGLFGIIATIGGVLDWGYHRNKLGSKLSTKERIAEAKALGFGGIPMFILMFIAMLHSHPQYFIIPILIILIYTVVVICYDEFVFHIKRCKKEETIYHRMLVFGNGIAWLSWFHFIYG